MVLSNGYSMLWWEVSQVHFIFVVIYDLIVITVVNSAPSNSSLPLSILLYFYSNFYFRITADVQLYDQTTGQGITSCTPLDHRTIKNCPKLLITVRRQGQKTAFSSFYDEDIIGDNWNPNGWNRIDMTVAMHPIISDPVITNARIVILGGPANSVLKMDNARARRITYNEIPAGHPGKKRMEGERHNADFEFILYSFLSLEEIY